MDKHDKYEVVKQAWFEINEHLRNNKQDYIEYLKFSAKMYKQPYSDAGKNKELLERLLNILEREVDVNGKKG